MRKGFIIMMLLLGVNVLNAQKFLYDVDFVFDFDDRESNDSYDGSQTILGFKLTPTIGVGFNDSIGGMHKLIGGVTYYQPCGADWKYVKVHPVAYYQFGYKGLAINFGFVPYNQMLEGLPTYLMSDSLAYATPNIQGLLLQYHSKWGYFEALADWRGMMSPETREAFRIVGGGKFFYEWFYAGGYAQMNHLSHNADTITGVCDDIVFNPLVGVNLSKYTSLDSLAIQAGYLGSWQRDRRFGGNYWCNGFSASVFLQWRFIGFRNELYVGENQMPLYAKYGTLLNQGDPRYQAKLYNRTDLYFYFIRRSFVTAWAGWGLIVTEDGKISHQPQVMCRFNLDGLLHHPSKTQIRTLSWR